MNQRKMPLPTPSQTHAGATANNLHSTLEQGLGLMPTKMGPGDKEEGYAMPKTRVRWFLVAIVAALVLLSVLVGIYAGLFNDERLRRFYSEKKAQEKVAEEKVDAVRLGIAMHQQEAEREHQEYDTKRALRRIMSVIGRKFDELMADTSDPVLGSQLRETKVSLTNFVNEELQDFEKEKRAYDIEAKKRLEKLAVAQEQSLRELLKSVSGVKMDAMEDMLEEVFAAGQKAPQLDVSDRAVDEIEGLADSLYEGKTTLATGKERLESIRLQIQGTLPDDLTRQFQDAQDADAFAQALDELVEITKLARGKKEIALIEETWRKSVEKARANDQQQGGGEGDENEAGEPYDEEIKYNVDAILAVQRLVAEGKVPVYLLDFEAIDMKDLQGDGNNNPDDQVEVGGDDQQQDDQNNNNNNEQQDGGDDQQQQQD